MATHQQRTAGVPESILRQHKLGLAEGWVPVNNSSGFVYKTGNEGDAYASYPPGLECTDKVGVCLSGCDIQAVLVIATEDMSLLLEQERGTRIHSGLLRGTMIMEDYSDLPSRFSRADRGACLIRSSKAMAVFSSDFDLKTLAREKTDKVLQTLVYLSQGRNQSQNIDPAAALATWQQRWTIRNLDESKSVSTFASEYKIDMGEEDFEPVRLDQRTRVPAPVVLENPETGEPVLQEGRSRRNVASMITGLALGFNCFIMMRFTGTVVIMTLTDQNWARLALLIVVPIICMVSQFLWENAVSLFAQLLFPIRQMHFNSFTYSGMPSEPLPVERDLPAFTIQMPVYKEGLETVLAPSIRDALKAVEAYRAQGGQANIVICEDGLRLLDEVKRAERIQFYREMDCGWVARPGNGDNGFERRGRFKKASNLNFTYTFSLQVEERMDKLGRTDPSVWTQADEDLLYREAFNQIVEERDGEVWASDAVRFGDYILLIDADTRMPDNCLIEAAAEMERCPEVGALQHCSGVMYSQGHFFERFIGYFTESGINFSISWACSNGASAPLMGHNVFLRWSAMQEVAKVEEDGSKPKLFFSEEHVSEDFELALRLQMKGYIVRWATYSHNQFKEGVSFTPEDEKIRLQKYGFGCGEIVLNPLKTWLWKGPFSKLFRNFLWSDVSSAHKVTTLSYLATYYAIAFGFVLTFAMFVLQALFQPWLDPIFIPPFDLILTTAIVFSLGAGIGQVSARWRSGHATFLDAIGQILHYWPAILCFFGGIAFHILLAILSQLFGIQMSWTTTNKDYQETNLGEVMRRYRRSFILFALLFIGVTVECTPLVPYQWRAYDWYIILPPYLVLTMHFLYPIVLDVGILHRFVPVFKAGIKKTLTNNRFFYAADSTRTRKLQTQVNHAARV